MLFMLVSLNKDLHEYTWQTLMILLTCSKAHSRSFII